MEVSSGSFVSCFSVAVRKHCDPKQLKEEFILASGFKGIETIMEGRHGPEHKAYWSHLYGCT